MHISASAIAIFSSIFLALFLSFLTLFLLGERGRAAQERARRMAEHRMNARLLRLNL